MGRPWMVSWQMLLLAASIPSSCFLRFPGQGKMRIHIKVEPETPRDGQSVTLTPERVDLFSCHWYRGAAEEKNKIFVYSLSPFTEQKNGPAFSGRESGATDCSLHITDLRLSDSGTYTLRMGGVLRNEMGATSITISEILSHPALWPTESLESENTSVTLYCNTSDRLDVSILWFKDGNPVQSKTGLSDRNRTLALTSITKEDEGIYTCQAVNPVSNAVSNPSKITLAYSSAEAHTGTVIGSLVAILVLMGILTYLFLRARHRNGRSSSLVVPTPQLYENDPPSGQTKSQVKPESPSKASNTYETLQPRIQSVYEEIKR
ncbi:carcinoembryonic antigen-related cell adhesion molecule 1-like [Zootoca vivipara]|uniref:carcinoembryonic antigen-related cell adhesion molecule 1-like n=1 Tax=Zootoca vivipara TaxID=8524 RepID=UPI0015914975|nr:carcinoembryonic antigen-related cell adhesion molecule 1-like [Zootoca vivipara]